MPTISSNVISNYLGMIVQIAIAFFMTPFLIESLGSERYGIWTMIAALAGYLTLFDLGIVSAITKYYAEYNAKKDKKATQVLLSSSAVLATPIALSIVLASPLIAYLFTSLFKFDETYTSEVKITVMVATIEVAVFVFAGLFRGVVFGAQRYVHSNVAFIITLFIKAGLVIYLLNNGKGLVELSIAYLSVTILQALIFVGIAAWTAPELRRLNFSPNKSTIKQVATHSQSTFLSMVAIQLVYYSDSFVIGGFLGATAVAYYTIAWSLSEYINRLTVIASRVLVPVFSAQATSTDSSELRHIYIRALRYQLILSCSLCGGFMVLGQVFITNWVNESFAMISGALLQILLVSQFFRGPQGVSYAYLQGVGKHKMFSIYNLYLGVTNLIISIAVVKTYGLTGVAIATSFTQVIFYGVIVTRLVSNTLYEGAYIELFIPWVKAAIATLVLVASLKIALNYFVPSSLLEVFFLGVVGSLPYWFAAAMLLLTATERRKIMAAVLKATRLSRGV